MIGTARHGAPLFEPAALGSREEPAALARIGALAVRLAGHPGEVLQAQRLRYQVFFEEGGAIPSSAQRLTGLDADRYDPFCDHLLITADGGEIVATARLLAGERAAATGGFYSDGEFEVGPLVARHPGLRFLEVGRVCVAAAHRSRLCLDLVWRGIAARALELDADVLIGCASLPGTDPDRLAQPLAFLHGARGDGVWSVSARAGLGSTMERCPAGAVDASAALRALPPLLRGYLKLGARVSREAVVDHAFGTTDVLVMLPLAGVGSRYRARFAPSGTSPATEMSDD